MRSAFDPNKHAKIGHLSRIGIGSSEYCAPGGVRFACTFLACLLQGEPALGLQSSIERVAVKLLTVGEAENSPVKPVRPVALLPTVPRRTSGAKLVQIKKVRGLRLSRPSLHAFELSDC